MSQATPPPNADEVKVGTATHYVRRDVEALAERRVSRRVRHGLLVVRWRWLALLAVLDAVLVTMAWWAFAVADTPVATFTAGFCAVLCVVALGSWWTRGRW